VKTGLGLVISTATLATIALGIAAVWLTGDPRAFGVIVTFAGVVAGIVAARQELHPTSQALVRRSPPSSNWPKAA
jgi:hypothetical protein